MKNKLYIFIIYLFVGWPSAKSQTIDTLLLELPVQSRFFTTDPLSNIYYINEKQELIKYITESGRVFTYSNKQLGAPSWIDAANPMKVLALYPDFQTVVLLDSRMGQVALFRLLATTDGNSYLPVAACAQPEDDFFWIFDQLSQRLVKLDERGNKVAQSESFLQMFDFTVNHPQLYYYNQTLFLEDPTIGLMVFDRFGSFLTVLDIQTAAYLQITREHFIYPADSNLVQLQRQLYGKNMYPLPVWPVTQARVVSDRLFLGTPDRIRVYRLPIAE
ncbi:MAG: hypothetical protein ABR95_02505 [Sphingobacteriales bacterium BACL12 MAG-120813-bin55]|nr:MAG: hypothetical protein ABR94_07970 [Sphingobacteriales bacterium BACL12 MAG-120802-bin5]KRP13818.1 MAG: hypothetical protein ABR95_02505 [Sphingobacteriales bacterium BACL12 MAG-120813-bin55]